MNHSTSPNTDRLPPAVGCDAGLIFAVPIEAAAFERLATDRIEVRAATVTFQQGIVAGHRVVWCVSGIGAEAAAAATRLLIDGHRPRLVITAGFAGGLDPALTRGSVVRPVGVAAWPASPQVTIVTVPSVIATVEAKRQLAARSGAQVVDMETHAVASVARAAGLDCASVRVVSDDASQELPREVAALAAPQPPLRRLGSVVGAIGKRPRAAVDLWRLWEHAVIDGRTLAEALADLLRSLPGRPSTS